MVSTINIVLLSERRIIIVVWRGKTMRSEKRRDERAGLEGTWGEKKGPVGSATVSTFYIVLLSER